MKSSINILHLEDDLNDAKLIKSTLITEGLECNIVHVSARADYIQALEKDKFDIILADYKLPDFDGLSALTLAHEKYPDIPFILISGTIGEEAAIESLKAGATDYVLKQRLSRLAPAVRRALKEAEEQRQHKRAEEKLNESEKRFRTLFESSVTGILMADIETGKFKYANPAVCKLLGYSGQELTTMGVGDIHPEYALEHVISEFEAQAKGEKMLAPDIPCLRKDGTIIYADINTNVIIIEGRKYNAGFFTDVTERKKMEDALQESEKKYRNLVDNALVGVYQTNIKGNFLYANDALARMLEFESPKEIMSESVLARYKNLKDREVLLENLLTTGKVSNFEVELLTKTGKTITVLLSAILDGDALSGMIRDITERKIAEEQIQRQLNRLAALRSIDMAITASLDLRVTLNVLLEQVINQLHVDAGTVLLLNPHAQTLGYGSGRGFYSGALKHTHLRLGEGYAGRAALERCMVIIPNLSETENGFSKSPLLSGEGFISYYAVPLIAKGNVKGVLEIFHRAPLDPGREWLDFLEALATQAAIAIDNASLFDNLQRSNVELILAYDSTLEGWSKALDLRDKETEGHSQRVTEMTVKIARAIGVSESELVHVRRGALLHDIGKMGIPDNILLKPGPLNDEEWKIMHKHPVFAHEMLSSIVFLRPALDIPYCHHEKWDSTGYPRGLKGEQIPLSARIFALVDVYDALNSDRPYRPAWPEEKIRKYINEETGKHFDPKVVEAFFKIDWTD